MKHTDLIVVLDRSGSMSSIARDMEGGFNQLIRDQRKTPGTCRVTLVQFDSHAIETVYTGKDLHEVPPLTIEPRGGTPLLQALGQTLTQAKAVIASLPKAQAPDQVVVLVITDGQENQRREFTPQSVKALVKDCEKEGWQFVYLGANVDAFAESAALGIAMANTSGYTPDRTGVQNLYDAVSANLSSYRSGRVGSMAFSGRQREDMQHMGTGAFYLTLDPATITNALPTFTLGTQGAEPPVP